MQKILIATPSYDGKVDVHYTNALLQTVLLGYQNEIEFMPLFMAYDSLVQRARNDLLAIAVESNVDGILWIDADMQWHPQWAVDLVKSGKDAVGLPVIKKSIEESYNVKCKPENLIVDADGYMKVDSIGTGFLYLSNKAFKHLWSKGKKYFSNNQERRWVFEVTIKNEDLYSEDTLMCEKLIKGGFDVYIDPAKTCSHIGTLKFTGNFLEFMIKVKEFNDNK
jgi:glycosyltransferase involved in cell wall biosynthesis